MPQNNRIEPMEAPKSGPGAKGVAGGALAAAVLIATPFIAQWEGKSNDPYFDLAHIETVCFGELHPPKRGFTSPMLCEARRSLGSSLSKIALPSGHSSKS